MGLSRAQLIEHWGEPDSRKGDRWLYTLPRPPACSDREIVYTLTIVGDAVTKVDRHTRQTGKHCAPTFE